METLQELLPLAIQGSILLLALAIGLDASFSDAIYVFMRPKLLLRSVAAINVVVPAFAVLIAALFPLTQVVKIAILLMAVSPLPVIAPGTELKLSRHKSYVYGLLIAVSVLSIVIVPFTVDLISAVFSGKTSISMSRVARSVFGTVLLPLVIGMILHRLTPHASEKAAHIVSRVATIMLFAGIIPILIAYWPTMMQQVGNGTILAIVAVVVVGLAAGHLLGGPNLEDRTSLAIASATRHPGIAILIANENIADPHIKATVLLFIFVSLAAIVPYQIWIKRHYHLGDTMPDRRA